MSADDEAAEGVEEVDRLHGGAPWVLDDERWREHAPGGCRVWSWCVLEVDEEVEGRRADSLDMARTVVSHRRRLAAVEGADGHRVVVGLRARDREAPQVRVVGQRSRLDADLWRDRDDDRVEAWGDLGAAGVQTVVSALALAVELMAEQSVATPTLRAVRAAAGTAGASR